ncbi:MAG: VOC family protein [Dehalococcoidia bacterium]|nr:VOC family protein [Dehalococcoidia bacterium]MYB48006.1 VOC family protein [Dehalococcoidia bacterium]MYD50513.1 VOC family protein [Dehalococcoidia bacterium]
MAKLKHIAIASQDPKKTAEFYRSVFGLKQVGNVEGDNAEGVYLTDGDISIAILKFKNETLAGLDYGVEYSGLHHIGFQVDDLSDADARLQAAEVEPSSDINSVRRSEMGEGHGGRNVALNYAGPDGVLIDVSQIGWVGAGAKKAGKNGTHPTNGASPGK